MNPELVERLTEIVRTTPGVIDVLPVNPIMHAAAEGIAATFDLQQPDVLVGVEESLGATSVTVHIATAASASTPETLRAVAARVRRCLTEANVVSSGVVVSSRLIE